MLSLEALAMKTFLDYREDFKNMIRRAFDMNEINNEMKKEYEIMKKDIHIFKKIEGIYSLIEEDTEFDFLFEEIEDAIDIVERFIEKLIEINEDISLNTFKEYKLCYSLYSSIINFYIDKHKDKSEIEECIDNLKKIYMKEVK